MCTSFAWALLTKLFELLPSLSPCVIYRYYKNFLPTILEFIYCDSLSLYYNSKLQRGSEESELHWPWRFCILVAYIGGLQSEVHKVIFWGIGRKYWNFGSTQTQLTQINKCWECLPQYFLLMGVFDQKEIWRPPSWAKKSTKSILNCKNKQYL